MNLKFLLAATLSVISISLIAQDTKPEKPSAKFYGYINWETIFDSHESATAREGELYLFPSAPTDDSENAQLEMLALQTRVGAKIDGGEVLGAKLSGVIEGDFFATSNDYRRQLRMRHAFIKLQWEKSSLLMGQYWHPMFGPDVFPKVLQFGASVIYNPLNRAPQIRYDYNLIDNFRITLAALAHGYHASKQPGANAQKNSGVPDMQFQLTYGSKDKFLTGITAGYLMLQPRDTITGGAFNYKTIGTYNLQWFGMAKAGPLTINAKASYGQNMSQFVMLGGYGRNASDTDPLSEFNYTPYKIMAVYGDFGYKISENIGAGLFVGYTENLGTEDKVTGSIFATGANIMNIYRISPRITYTAGPLRFGLEYAYDAAAYGDGAADEYGVYDKTKEAINHRLLFAVKFTF
jgi:hypothetical protein